MQILDKPILRFLNPILTVLTLIDILITIFSEITLFWQKRNVPLQLLAMLPTLTKH